MTTTAATTPFIFERQRQPLQRSESRHSSGIMAKDISGEHSLRGHKYEVNLNIPQLKHNPSPTTVERYRARLDQRLEFSDARPGL
jgi:hypothetical protein